MATHVSKGYAERLSKDRAMLVDEIVRRGRGPVPTKKPTAKPAKRKAKRP
jgi:hypothetical protein